MSTLSVRKAIQSEMKPLGCTNAVITGPGMKKIGAAAESDGIVRPGEAVQIADLLEKGHTPPKPGQIMTMACPEHPASYFSINSAAKKEANALFVRNSLPYGKNEAVIRAKINAVIDQNGWGEQLSKKPNTTGLHAIEISNKLMVDGPKVEALLNAKTGKFFVKVTGSGFGGPQHIGPFYYGPNTVDLKAPVIKDSTLNKMRAALMKNLDTLEFSASGMPLGVKYTRAELMREKHPDGYTYSALIPTGVVYPGAPSSDPNKATQIYIERSGGFAGLTEVAGPISLK